MTAPATGIVHHCTAEAFVWTRPGHSAWPVVFVSVITIVLPAGGVHVWIGDAVRAVDVLAHAIESQPCVLLGVEPPGLVDLGALGGDERVRERRQDGEHHDHDDEQLDHT